MGVAERWVRHIVREKRAGHVDGGGAERRRRGRVALDVLVGVHQGAFEVDGRDVGLGDDALDQRPVVVLGLDVAAREAARGDLSMSRSGWRRAVLRVLQRRRVVMAGHPTERRRVILERQPKQQME